MRRLPMLIALALATPALAARPPMDDARAAQRAELKRLLETKPGVEVRLAPGSASPRFLRRGAEPLARAQGHDAQLEAAGDWLREHKQLFLSGNADAALDWQRSSTDAQGGRHHRFRQRVNGVPVHKAEVLAHFDAAGALHAVSASTVALPDGIDTAPRLFLHEAEYIAAAHFNSADVRQRAALELREFAQGWRLVYAVHSTVNGVNRWLTLVDAHTGEALEHRLDHRDGSASASGADLAGRTRRFHAWQDGALYYLVDVTLPALVAAENPFGDDTGHGNTHVVDLMHTDGSEWRNITSAQPHAGWDAAGVSALANSQLAYRYFEETHGRAGVDGRHAGLLSAVHYKTDYDNAYWNGEWMVFGDGGYNFTSFARCADMVVHEYTHGVIDHSANLAYENQSGALNESFADVFGALATGNWTLGEGCVKREPGYLRSLAAPGSGLRWQPRHMAEYAQRPNTKDGDWGGVHANSGIPNHAAWLLIEGLTQQGLGTSIGPEKAGRLYYYVLTHYLVADSDFLDLRRAMLLAAEYLFPGSALEREAVAVAFDAVGIVEGASADAVERGALAASAVRLDFGDVEEAASRELVLTNSGDGELVVHEVRLDGEGFTHDFANTRLAPGESLHGTVSFVAADTAGSHAASLEVITDSGQSPLVIDLLATVPAAKTVAPAPSAAGGGALHALLLPLLGALAMQRRLRFPVKVSSPTAGQGDMHAPETRDAGRRPARRQRGRGAAG